MFIYVEYDPVKDMGILKSDYLTNIREHFSEEDVTASIKKHLYKGKARHIPSRRYIITEAGRFELGMTVEIIKYLKTLNTPFKINFTEEFKNRYKCSYSFHDEPLVLLEFLLRDYQDNGVRAALRHGCGVELVPTGGGKTLIMASIIMNVLKNNPNTKIMLITLTHLVTQIYDEFISYGIDPLLMSKWCGDANLNPNANITISGTNILYSPLDNTTLQLKKANVAYLGLTKLLKMKDVVLPEIKRKEIESDIIIIAKDIKKLEKKIEDNSPARKYLENVNLLLIDEVHTFKKGNEINELFKFIKTRNRIGFTGTMPESLIDQWTIIGNIGPIIHEIPREILVENKFITDVDIKIIKLNYKILPNYKDINDTNDDDVDEDEIDSKMTGLNKKYLLEIEFIQKNEFRNNIIKKICNKVTKNTLIVLDRLQHGDYLLEYLTREFPNKKVYFIKGEVENEDRDNIKKIMEQNSDVICIAISKIFSTGINIKNLHYIIFAASGKAKIRTIQTIGRGVRTLEGKDRVTIFDIADWLKYGSKHLEKRLKIYEIEKLKYEIIEINEK